jgi:hypothetical protein
MRQMPISFVAVWFDREPLDSQPPDHKGFAKKHGDRKRKERPCL